MSGRDVPTLRGLRFDPPGRTAKFSLALALAALWLLGRRYAGFVHDASIYAVQGLRKLDPTLGNDLFFNHGAQDAYTLFPTLYAAFIAAFGTATAALIVTLAGQAAFLAAATALVWRLVPAPGRWWSLALLAVMSGFYGGAGVFRMAEPFATARTLAEPLVAAALAATVVGRPGVSCAALVVALALHPLVAAPGIAVVYVWHALAQPRLWWLAAIGAAFGIVALCTLPELHLRLDQEWLGALVQRSPHLFIAYWQAPDWARLAWGATVAWLALRHAALTGDARRLVRLTLLIAVCGIAASAVLVDGARSALAASLQLWRAHWLLHLLAIVLLPAVVMAFWRQGGASRAGAALLAASVCFGRAEQVAAVALALFAAGFVRAGLRRPDWLGEKGQRLALLFALCAAAVGLLLEVQVRMPLQYGASPGLHGTGYVAAFTTVGGLLPLAAVLWLIACSRFALSGLVAAVLATAGALAAWDARSPWLRFVDEASQRSNPLRDAIPPGAQVHWPGPYGRTWLVLGRPEWWNVDQGAGIVFHRATAIAYLRRQEAAGELADQTRNCILTKTADCSIALRPAQTLCRRHQGPDFLLLNAKVEGRPGLEWRIPAEFGAPLQLYSCTELRK